MIWGARASLLAGVVSVAIAVRSACRFGLIAGYFGGWTTASSRGRPRRCWRPLPDPRHRAGGLPRPQPDQRDDRHRPLGGADLHPPDARAGPGVKTEDYVEGARAIGLGTAIITRYILPNVIPADPGAGDADHRHRDHRRGVAVLPRPRPAAAVAQLGLDAEHAKNFLSQAPWMALWPGAAIFLVVLGFNLMGDGLRDALDPREH
jgi:peptide/nickel transport system permease protein